jgi:hypothetical protein
VHRPAENAPEIGLVGWQRLRLHEEMIVLAQELDLLSLTPALPGVDSTLQRSPSTEPSAGTAAMPSLQEFHTAAGVNKLPIEVLNSSWIGWLSVVP